MRPLVHNDTFSALCDVRERLAEAHDRKISLHTAAEMAAMSPFHFHRMFRRAFGETPADYLARIRHERARQMLLSGDWTVSEVCIEVGYESLPSFSAAFKMREGCAPTEFRRCFAAPGMWMLKSTPACLLDRWLVNGKIR